MLSIPLMPMPRINNAKIRKEFKNPELEKIILFKDGIAFEFKGGKSQFFTNQQLHSLTLKQEFIAFCADVTNRDILTVSLGGAAAQSVNNTSIILAVAVYLQAPLEAVALSTAPTVVGIPVAVFIVSILAVYIGHEVAKNHFYKTEKKWSEDLISLLKNLQVEDKGSEKMYLGDVTKISNSNFYKTIFYQCSPSVGEYIKKHIPDNDISKQTNLLYDLMEKGRVAVHVNESNRRSYLRVCV